jgi:hypothetical protein
LFDLFPCFSIGNDFKTQAHCLVLDCTSQANAVFGIAECEADEVPKQQRRTSAVELN